MEQYHSVFDKRTLIWDGETAQRFTAFVLAEVLSWIPSPDMVATIATPAPGEASNLLHIHIYRHDICTH